VSIFLIVRASYRTSAVSTAAIGSSSMQCFTQLQDISVTSETTLVSWCPTMDVCAVVSADGQLHLHRMDWQLLWSDVPQSMITALCWHPTGKSLAVGHNDGSFKIMDTESGHVKATQRAHYARIVHLSWSEEPSSSTSNKSSSTSNSSSSPEGTLFSGTRLKMRHKTLFAPIHPPGATNPAHQPTHPDSSAPYDLKTNQAFFGVQPGESLISSWGMEPKTLDIMSVTDSKGRISLWVHGQVQVCVSYMQVEPGPSATYSIPSYCYPNCMSIWHSLHP
jgi:WD40 repeat protein